MSSPAYAWDRLERQGGLREQYGRSRKCIQNPIVKGQYQTADNPILEVFYLADDHAVLPTSPVILPRCTTCNPEKSIPIFAVKVLTMVEQPCEGTGCSTFHLIGGDCLTTQKILKILQSDIHSVVFATLDEHGLPQTCVIDLMLADDDGLYFLTAKGKSFTIA